MLPPLLPAQDHVQGPEPLIVEAVPAVQSPVVGALVNCDPFDVPHAPFTGGNTSEAEQLAVPPPLLPGHDQFHGPLPVTDEAVPVVQRPVAGALVRSAPLEAPQLALSSSNAEHELQSQGPLPLNDETEPVLQRPVVGALVRSGVERLLDGGGVVGGAVAGGAVSGLHIRPVRERPDEFLVAHRLRGDRRTRHNGGNDRGGQPAQKLRLHPVRRRRLTRRQYGIRVLTSGCST